MCICFILLSNSAWKPELSCQCAGGKCFTDTQTNRTRSLFFTPYFCGAFSLNHFTQQWLRLGHWRHHHLLTGGFTTAQTPDPPTLLCINPFSLLLTSWPTAIPQALSTDLSCPSGESSPAIPDELRWLPILEPSPVVGQRSAVTGGIPITTTAARHAIVLPLFAPIAFQTDLHGPNTRTDWFLVRHLVFLPSIFIHIGVNYF